MSFYPIYVDLEGKKIVLVGGGRVAQRKIETFLEYGALIFLISRDMTPKLEHYKEEGKLVYLGAEFHDDYLENASLVVSATDDPELNHRVSEAAKSRGLLVNAVDQPADCSFIVPSIVKRGDLMIAVSTSGKSPAFAKQLRKELEKKFGNHYGTFLTLMGNLRSEIIKKDLPVKENSRIFQELVESSILEAIDRGDWGDVASILNRILQTQMSSEDVLNYLEAG
ncbi:bifunctional precorrin-2 dehydrogenase/sirohydrochlorin ferrochelatase [Thermodesulfobacteriota bacterium]